MNKNNIILFLSEHHEYSAINENVTPNLTLLAHEGILFHNNFTSVPFFAPAKECIETGLYVTQRYSSQGIPLQHDIPTLAQYLNKAGYDSYVSDNDLGKQAEKPFFMLISHTGNSDDTIGELIKKLKALNLYNNTTIIYTSICGVQNSKRKMTIHDKTIHTPLIIKGSGFEGGKTEASLTSLIDIPPTLLRMAEIPIPHTFRGFDLKKIICSDDKMRECVFIQYGKYKNNRAIRTERFKYSASSILPKQLNYNTKIYFEDYFYDLQKDPNENHNLVKNKRYRHVREELKYLLLKQMEKAGEEPPMILPAIKVKNIPTK